MKPFFSQSASDAAKELQVDVSCGLTKEEAEKLI